MTAQILVVDDIPANVKLLEAKLNSEYYDVLTATNGEAAIAMVKEHKPDLVLLDVMMPGIDGFETCRRLKADPTVSHIPVVMVTALSDISDRVVGLEAGADDFITKPINDTALFARVRSLVRIKVLMDELRLRDKTGAQMGVLDESENSFTSDVSGSHIVLIDDDMVQSKKMYETLIASYRVTLIEKPEEAIDRISVLGKDIDIILVSTQFYDVDGLRLATQIKNIEPIRHVPIVLLVDEQETDLMLKGLELGINDYLVVPVDANEMQARIKTQIRRKKYQDALKSNYKTSISLAMTDQLTGLYNRHYMDAHLQNMVQQSLANGKPLSALLMDMDHFKLVNDNYGHNVGDEVLKQLADVIISTVRSSDLAARYGGEEFVVLLPETDFNEAYELGERMRRNIEANAFQVSHEIGTLYKTTSVGVAAFNIEGDTGEELIKRADEGLYAAKEAGRNRVCPLPEALMSDMKSAHLQSGF